MKTTTRVLSTALTAMLLALAFNEGTPALVAAITPAQASQAGAPILMINGVNYGGILSAEGGHPVADVITQQGSPTPSKHVANVRYAPLRLVLPLPLDAKLVAHINAFITGTQQGSSITLSQGSGTAGVGRIDATDAMLTEVQFSSLDASSKTPATVTLVYRPRTVSFAKGGALPAGPVTASKKSASQAQFALSLGTLPCARVASIEAITLARGEASDALGSLRTASTTPGEIKLGNLVLSISASDAAAWVAWENSFLIQGQSTDASELTGTLSLLSSDMKTSLLEFQFSHLGLVSLERPRMSRSESSSIQRLRAELYMQGLTLTNGGNTVAKDASESAPAPATSTAADTTPAANGAAQGNEDGPGANVAPSPAGEGPAAVTGTPSAVAPTVPPQSKLPRSTSPLNLTPLKAETAGPLVAVQNGDPLDQGAREPADFPRIAGMRRVSYTCYAAESKLEETANYESKLSIAEVSAGYEKALKAAGWTQSFKSESGSAADNTLYKHHTWTRAVQGADLRLSQTKTGGTTLVLTTDAGRAGILSGITASFKGIDPGKASEASPADQGAKDPADFPRMAKSVRRSYRNSGTATAPYEVVVYRAKLPLQQVEGFYVNQLNAAEWEQLTRRERGDPLAAEHEVTHTWARGARNAKVTLLEVEPSITQITLEVGTTAQ